MNSTRQAKQKVRRTQNDRKANTETASAANKENDGNVYRHSENIRLRAKRNTQNDSRFV